jgi:hypothetical protein
VAVVTVEMESAERRLVYCEHCYTTMLQQLAVQMLNCNQISHVKNERAGKYHRACTVFDATAKLDGIVMK